MRSGLAARPQQPRAVARVRGVVLAVAAVLALAGLDPIFAGTAWFHWCAVAAAGIPLLGALLRSARVPGGAVTLGQGLAFLAVAVYLVRAGHIAATPVEFGTTLSGEPPVPVPTGTEPAGGSDLAGAGILETLRATAGTLLAGLQGIGYSFPPVDPEPAMILGLVALITVVVMILDLMFVDLNWHLPTALLLALFPLPAMIVDADGTPLHALLLPALAALIVLATRTVHPDRAWYSGERRPHAGPAARPLALAGVTALAGAVALGAGTLAPALVRAPEEPRFPLTTETLSGWQTGAFVDGPMAVSESVSVRRDLRLRQETELFTYTTDSENPDYLRLTTLTEWTGDAWEADPTLAQGAVPMDRVGTAYAESLEGAPAIAAHDLEIAELRDDQLPVPLSTVAVTGDVDGRWAFFPDQTVRSQRALTRDDQQYRTLSVMPTPSEEDLQAVTHEEIRALAGASRIPAGADVRESLRVLSDQIVADAGAATPFERAEAIEAWFHDNFRYSLSTRTPDGADPIDSFLDDRAGYCEQFAATMALLTTAQGIPTRVAVGFTAGESAGADRFRVTNHNAHAWPELWFGENIGWVRFEPTPSDGSTGIAAPDLGVPARDAAPEADEATEDPEPATGEDIATPDVARPTEDIDGGGVAQDGTAAETGVPDAVWWGLGVLVLAGVIAALAWYLPRRARAARRAERLGRSGRRALADGVWDELGETARDVGLELSSSEPPKVALAALVDDLGAAGVEVGEEHRDVAVELGAFVSTVRYARPAEGEADRPVEPGSREDRNHRRAETLLRALDELRSRR